MTIIDAQLHEPFVSLDWGDEDIGTRRKVLTEVELAFMRAVGVDRAVLHPMYDLEWAEQLASQSPDKFAVVCLMTPGGTQGLDIEAPNIDELVAEQCRKPTTVGLRILPRAIPPGFRGEGYSQVRAGLYDRALAACEQAGVALFMATMGDLTLAGQVAARYQTLKIVIDAIGLLQPPSAPRGSLDPFADIPDLLSLAPYPNIFVKFVGAPSIAREPYPYLDVWPHLHRVIDTFGVDRLMWGSDASKFAGRIGFTSTSIPGGFVIPETFEGQHSYAEALHYLLNTDEISPTDKEWLLWRTAEEVLEWS